MKRQTIVGLIAALMTGTVVVAAAAADGEKRSPLWPKTKGSPVVSEWFTDIPWRQKLGTYQGNKIDIAIVLPYDVLRPDAKTACASVTDPLTGEKRPLSQEQCMIEIGVTNIMGTLRTDTPYDPDDDKIKGRTYCKASGDSTDTRLPCIEVKLELSNWWAQPEGTTLPPNANTLNQQAFGVESGKHLNGFVFTEASVYAPQMPWYMSHYCDSRWDGDSQDPVCYGDYISPMNSAFNGNALPNLPAREWPEGKAFSVYPFGAPPAPGNHCQDGLKTCTIALAGFDLSPVPSDPAALQYQPYNDYLIRWFNRALASFPDQVTAAERDRHFAWITKTVGWEDFVYPQALHNPFQGAFKHNLRDASKCNISFDGNNGCGNTGDQFAESFRYPGQCSLGELAGAAGADLTAVAKLRNCSLAYEIHPNGFAWQWRDPKGKEEDDHTRDFIDASMEGNQYGRTSFLFAGVPGMQLPVSFLKDTKSDSGLSIYEQVYNASIFSMYLPIANVADIKNAVQGRNYKAMEFYHTLLMSNHNEADPWQFADGIRGKVLWHNEYRMQGMYRDFKKNGNKVFRDRTFAASFNPASAKAPFHNETCDGCHVRNGSGIPINTEIKLDKVLQEFMTDGVYNASTGEQNYTFTGQIRPMKLVFFDLRRDAKQLDASRYSEPLSLPPAVVARAAGKARGDDTYYNNKIMNYYGDSFHVTTPGYNYVWNYVAIPDTSNRLVVKDVRKNQALPNPYKPQQTKLEMFQTSSSCVDATDIVLPSPTTKPWPSACKEINGNAISAAIASQEVGFMHLNGKRLGNLSAMEAIPNQAIIGFREEQLALLEDKIAGEIIWQAGSRDGIYPAKGGQVKTCDGPAPKDLSQCFIARFGWIGDRVSLEDQVANAAFVEMNMTTSEGYKQLYPKDDAKFPIRYAHPNCGPANKKCVDSKGNADLTERDVERMADYARWLGNPTRSEFKVALPEVIAGEKIFRETGCATCHVIQKIGIDPDNTMLTKGFRDRLKTRFQPATATAPKAAPFLSYIGTDLLMHDMGYLSQVAEASEPIRDGDGVVLRLYKNYVQKIRTPALKGLGYNRFVTDSFRNTKSYAGKTEDNMTMDAGCDFLLHDGRACDAIEAAFLHDGPAIKKLGVIPKLNALSKDKVDQLRAFLYSL